MSKSDSLRSETARRTPRILPAPARATLRPVVLARSAPAVLAILVILVTAACGPASPGAAPPDLAHPDFPPPFCTDGADGGPPATLASVEYITAQSCVASGCHGSSLPQFDDLDLRPGHVIAATVNVRATEGCGGVRVVPGDPQSSYLYQKVATTTPCSPTGAGYLGMPRCEDGTCPLPSCQIEVIRRWIAAGAHP